MSEDTAIAATGGRGTKMESWVGAAQRGLEARQERAAIISSVLSDGVDYGLIPGCGDKKALFKSGAEKVSDSLNLYPDYEQLAGRTVEDWGKPLFNYSYRCVLRHRGTDLAVATGIGSCNSMESRYRYRDGQRKCPECGATAIIKGKAEYGGGWLCFAKKGGCGAKWPDDAEVITKQQTGRVPNDDIFTQVNTIDKMAQKRAMVAAALNLGFSEQFTQDIEDNPGAFDGTAPPPQETAAPTVLARAPLTNPIPFDEPPHPAETVPPADSEKEFGTWKGRLRSVDKSEGEGARGPWTRYALKCPDSPDFSTFDTKLGETAEALVGEPVEIGWQKKGKYYNLVDIFPAEGA